MTSTVPTFGFYIDWASNGEFSGPGENVTSRVLAAAGLSVSYGRDQARALSPPKPGTAAFTLSNVSRDYSPDNTASPLTGRIAPGKPVLITVTQNGVTSNLYQGFLDDFTIGPNRDTRNLTVTCLDVLARFQQVTLSTELHFTVRTGAAIGLILDEIGWPAAARDIDSGASTFRWWWEDGTDGLTALAKVLAAEGPPALYFMSADGKFTFRDRHHRFLDTPSLTSQVTFSNGSLADDATHATYSQPSEYDFGWRDIVNTVNVTCDERSPQPGPPVFVWQDSAGPNAGDGTDSIRATYAVPANSAIQVSARASDPFTSAVFTTSNYLLLSGTVTTSLSRTSGQSAVISITDTSGGGSVVANLSITGVPVTVASSRPVTAQDTASAAAYGIRGLPSGIDLTQVAAEDAAAVAAIYLARYAQRRPIITIPVASASSYRLTQQTTRDLSDRVTITDTETGFTGDCHIEQITHNTSASGRVLFTTFGCEQAPGSAATPFTFNDASLGFNNGQFAATGVDDPATLFVWDDNPRSKFGTGLWAT